VGLVERATRPANERRLSRAELAGDGDDVARPEVGGKPRGHRFGLLG
jgi:hypothetical protein